MSGWKRDPILRVTLRASWRPALVGVALVGLVLAPLLLAPSVAPADAPRVMPPYRPASDGIAPERGAPPTDLRGPVAWEPASTASRLRAAAPDSVHLLVLLAAFADKAPRIDRARFDDLLFGPAPSLRDYYLEVSRGELPLGGVVHDWVTLPHSQLWYSQNVGGVGLTYPNNAQKMAEDAVQATLDAGFVDLNDFDVDQDGVVDALLVIHSGQGYEWAVNAQITPEPDAQAINSHKWTLVQRQFGAGQPQVIDYFTCPELQLVKPLIVPNADSLCTIGVYCHEFGHMLGLPDFYDTGTAENHIGVWAIMDYGSWNRRPTGGRPGNLPSHFCAWSKLYLGWLAPTILTAPAGESLAQTVSLSSASTTGGVLQILDNPLGVDWELAAPGLGEYFLAEVRTRTGYDAGLPAAGLLLYHADEDRPDNDASDNPDGGGLLHLLPADDEISVLSSSSAEDPWSGAQTEFGPSSTPSSARYDGSASGVSLTDISALAGGSVTFGVQIANTGATPAPPFARPNPWSAASGGDIELVLAAPGAGIAAGATVHVHDVTGRRVRILGADHLDAERRVARWDGRTGSGLPAAAGLYFFRVAGDGAAGTGRVLLLR